METSVIADIGYIATTITAVLVLISSIRNGRLAKQGNEGIGKVEILVNGKMTALMERVEQLTAALEGSDTEVPDPPPAPIY